MEQLVNFIIRPPRAEYNPEHDLLAQEFMLNGKWYQRKDKEIENSRGDVLQCSHYVPIVIPEGKALPCVIYCHGNSGCRTDASEAAIILLRLNITVFTLDFSGSGLSGGEHVTLGWNEKDDLRAVVHYLRADGNVSMIGLWGRSMGAVTSLMYGADDPSIAGMVLDSPFSDLVDLMMELVDAYKVRLPKFTVKFAIQYMRRAIQKKANFDIMELNTIKVSKSCFVPVLLGHAIDDDFIQPHHSERIFDAYVGDKNIIKFEGDHNSPRPQFYFDSISIFFNNVLQPPDDGLDGTFLDTMHDYIDKATWNALHGLGYSDGKSVALSEGPATTSTEDAIEQLRSRRPMSRMEVPPDIATGGKQYEVKEDGTGNDSSSSSSGMISFEFSNGHPYGPQVPASIEDDCYVEYPLDYSADFPCDLEEEERMLMEAVRESLKDLEMTRSHSEEPASSRDGDLNAPSTKESSEPPNADPNPATAASFTNSASGNPPPETVTYPADVAGPAFENKSSAESGCLVDCTDHDTSVNIVRPAEVDSEDGTKTLPTVEKNSSGHHIMDGLFRRWDRNFFRSSR
ncbi:hypothetical protein Nepgr_010217 [Nepenthes gracilis]|uniref:Serine aminopeptidase S33 domain-containing protein n=1 Tax=Nepenthes gracilis TaxID=150966 RepID=A0AAD3SC42_NEPGR|nr:hypothetical protein Nepgr_010217 [Nepenthes gracilis]